MAEQESTRQVDCKLENVIDSSQVFFQMFLYEKFNSPVATLFEKQLFS